MSQPFSNDKPIFIQVREMIENQIVNGQLKEGEQAPSTNQLVQFYKINHATVSKGVNQLVEEEILYKVRGVGMFVSEGAKESLIRKRREAFTENYIVGLVKEAGNLDISIEEIVEMIKNQKDVI